ncbi:MAG TPA: NAD(P)H-hydrate dehydratase [Rhodocyclaceae bacterium]|nr:NAD(P)H-hydrate dehydratase [Rhodocyclaceae bacterium]
MDSIRLLLVSPALRVLEQRFADTPLMERAGAAAASLAVELQKGLTGAPLIFVGPGNNGGDGLVVARLLKKKGLAPVVVSRADPERMPADARHAWESWIAAGGKVERDVPSGKFGLLIDALFGIGLTRPAEGIYADWIDAISRYPGPVQALDCPSGLNADTGRALGPVVRASHTITFISAKPGLYTLNGPDHCGHITVADLSLGDAIAALPHGRVVSIEDFRASLLPRPRNSHKGSNGNAVVVGGATGMTGAALLAGRAALKLGAGRIYVGMLDRLPVDPQQPELMLRSANEAIPLATALAVGPGLGDSTEATDLLRQSINTSVPLVIDADGINLLAAHPALHNHVARREDGTVLTPHPLEAARLLGCDVTDIQADRIAAAKQLASRFNAHVVLKGVGSVIAAPDCGWAINTTGNPGLASAGTGDVLTGFTVALLAQGWAAAQALTAAVHLHGLAADHCVAEGIGPIGLTASELISPARALLNRWIAHD